MHAHTIMSDETTRTQGKTSRQGMTIGVSVAAIVLLTLYIGTPVSENWILKCPLYQLTGWQCPLCGSQRAIHEMLHGHMDEAWCYNPALWIVMPYLVTWAVGALIPGLERYRVVKWVQQDWVLAVVALALLLWGVVRNL